LAGGHLGEQLLLCERRLAGRDLVELTIRAQARFSRIHRAITILIASELHLLCGRESTQVDAQSEAQQQRRRSEP
jgi:hypothetical protein